MQIVREQFGDERIGHALDISEDALSKGLEVPNDALDIVTAVVASATEDSPRTLAELAFLIQAAEVVPIYSV